MPLADYYDMVKAFPPQRANHPLRIGVLPWRAWRNDRLPDVQQPRLTRKSFAIDLIPVPDQMPRALFLPARLDQLSCRPFRRRVLGDIEMHQPAPAVAQHDQHKEHSKGRCRHREEIQRDQIPGMVHQKCAPCLRRRPPRPEHVLRNCRLRDRHAQLQQLAVDPRRTPERIRAAHLPNQIPQFPPNRGPTPSASTLPCPVQPETPAVPPHHGLGPHHLQRTPPILPQSRQHDPEDPVHLRQPWPWLTRFPHGELLPQREILQRQLAACANRGAECPKKDPKPSDHGRPNSRSLRTTQDRCDGRVFRRDSLAERHDWGPQYIADAKSDPVFLDTVWTTMTAAKEAGHEGQGAEADHDSWQ